MTIVSRVRRSQSITFILILYCLVAVGFSFAAPVPAKRRRRVAAAAKTPVKKGPTAVAYTTTSPLGVVAGGPWTEPTYADSTNGDNVDGEDLEIRRAAVESLGAYNGSVVVVDPQTGRILSMVNQKVALSSGFQPCSTVKVSVALAGLSEKAVDPESKYRLNGMKMDLTYALAHSNNYFFAMIGEKSCVSAG